MDNLPFSNQKGEGYENKIAELIAKVELEARIHVVADPAGLLPDAERHLL